MVWGCITTHGRTHVIIVNGNMNGVYYLDDMTVPDPEALQVDMFCYISPNVFGFNTA